MVDLHSLVPLPNIWDSMLQVETRLLEVTTSPHVRLTEMAQHLIRAGGKRYRPLLTLLGAEFGPNPDYRAVEAATSVELIHLGSLYHDDVIDEADTRRGAVSVNANWSNTVAILAGDYLMARSAENAATHLTLESARLLAATYADLVEGQTREMGFDFDTKHSPTDYEKVMYLKTGSLIRTSARVGAMSSDASQEVIEAVSEWATELGIVFQIVDDILDLVASSDSLGKPAGSDILEGKFTLPVLMALEGSSGAEVRSLLDSPHPYSQDLVDRVVEIVRNEGYLTASLDAAAAHLDRAATAASSLPDRPAKEVLSGLGNWLLDRVASVSA